MVNNYLVQLIIFLLIFFTEEQTRRVIQIKKERFDCKSQVNENSQNMKEWEKKYSTLMIEHHKLIDEKLNCSVKIHEQEEKIKKQEVTIQELQNQRNYPDYIELSEDE